MKKLGSALVFGLGLVVSGCGSDGNNCLIQFNGANATCISYIGSAYTGVWEAACTAQTGTATDTCPTDLSFGVCSSDAGGVSEVTVRSYTGDAAAQQAACEAQSGKTWIAD